MRYYNSLNFYNQDGVAIRTGLKRFSLKSNLDFGSDKLTANLNLGLGYSKSQFTEGEGTTSVGTSMASVYYALPYEYPYAPDGTLIHFGNESDYFILDQREGSAGLERLFNSSDKKCAVKNHSWRIDQLSDFADIKGVNTCRCGLPQLEPRGIY